jgi:hypothetical protein
MTEPTSTDKPHLKKIALLQRIIEQLNSVWVAECFTSHRHNSNQKSPKGDQTDVDTGRYFSGW